ncbi:hypothetical protein [Citrobacter europaeus]|uniref:hypothetical protein n=1 Tax=Citrobacter europaeus TaxID=1914243 RepID=UPI0030D49ACD
MSDMIFYTEPDFQGESLTIASHDNVEVYALTKWTYRSVRLNNNKAMISASYNDFDPVNQQENFMSEDIRDLADTIHVKDSLSSVTVFNLNSDDIIVSMDAHCDMRGLKTNIDSEAKQPPLFDSYCFEKYTTDAISGTLAILNPVTLLSSDVYLTCESHSIYSVGSIGTGYGTATTATITYSPETKDVVVTPAAKQVSVTVEKVDEHHFLAHFVYDCGIYDHCIMHPEEDYRGYNAITPEDQFSNVRNVSGSWNYKSMEIISDSNYKTSWLWTDYPAGGDGYDMSQYRSFTTSTSLPRFNNIFDSGSSNQVSLAYSAGGIPVLLRLTNTDASANWKDFVIESYFNTEMFTVRVPIEYHTFCANNPDAAQPGMVCVVNESNLHQDFNTCLLRYGSLSTDGATVTWAGETTLNIEYASTDTLTLSLGSEAPADWVITAVTRGDDCWYVDLSGSVPA